MERTEQLGIGGLSFIQDTDLFCFGTDSVLLSDFAKIKKGEIAVDLCTGNGIIPILLCAKTNADKIYGIEIQKRSYGLAVKNAKINNLCQRLEFINDDIKNWSRYFVSGSIDVVTVNPPYMVAGAGLKNPDDAKAVARHEICTDLDSVCKYSSKLLKFGGRFYMVHRADRLCDVISAMRSYKIEPKRLTFVNPDPYHSASLILIEGKLGASSSLKLEKPIYANM